LLTTGLTIPYVWTGCGRRNGNGALGQETLVPCQVDLEATDLGDRMLSGTGMMKSWMGREKVIRVTSVQKMRMILSRK
jgi:hypothetical protein